MSEIRVCPQCGSKNRIPANHVGDTGKCGKCGTAIGPAGEPIDVDAAAFDAVLKSAKVPVLVDFWAPWCGPCVRAAPEVKKAANALKGRAIVLKLNTQDNPDVARRYGIRGIPNFMVFREGAPVQQQTGLVPADTLIRLADAA